MAPWGFKRGALQRFPILANQNWAFPAVSLAQAAHNPLLLQISERLPRIRRSDTLRVAKLHQQLFASHPPHPMLKFSMLIAESVFCFQAVGV